MQDKKTRLAVGLLFGFSYVNVQAALIDRGSGLLYDTALNITWLQDADFVQTSGYDADGLMLWSDAKTWAADLVYHDSIRNVDYSDWRLPRNSPVNGVSFSDLTQTNDGSGDLGYNITSPHSEMAYMYNVNLGLKGWFNVDGSFRTDYGVHGDGSFGGQENVGLVHNLQDAIYWSDTAVENVPFGAWGVDMAVGSQNFYYVLNSHYAWAVRDGDVAAVPLPGAIWLFVTGIAGVLGLRRRR
ncbi:MAG: hypothetical protein ABL919_12410 [Methylococcales bacterium]